MSSAFKKHHRKKKKEVPEEEPEFQIAPMIDVLLVLLVFFMSITSTEVLKKRPTSFNLKLPDASHSKETDKKQAETEVLVNVNGAARAFDIEGKTFTDNQLPMLTDIIQQKKSLYQNDPARMNNFRVLLRADKDTEYSFLQEVMRACAKAGVFNITFSVVKDAKDAEALAEQNRQQ